jgi:hypothetical protein
MAGEVGRRRLSHLSYWRKMYAIYIDNMNEFDPSGKRRRSELVTFVS